MSDCITTCNFTVNKHLTHLNLLGAFVWPGEPSLKNWTLYHYQAESPGAQIVVNLRGSLRYLAVLLSDKDAILVMSKLQLRTVSRGELISQSIFQTSKQIFLIEEPIK